MRWIYLFLMVSSLAQNNSFKSSQLKNARVKAAYDEKEVSVKKLFEAKKLPYENFDLLIRAFKNEKALEVWVKTKNAKTFELLTTYPFCTTSGVLGPKRKEGDLQIPEGVYHINHFNPLSDFYLSLGVSYPNASDKILSDPKSPGGAIYVHGNCVTIGCIPITDDKIKELYLIAVEARNYGQEKIPIHIFPARLTDENMTNLKTSYANSPRLIKFWDNLKPVYQYFEKNKVLPEVKINKQGEYLVQENF
jgi:murein L,D-transpeptidase YafK